MIFRRRKSKPLQKRTWSQNVTNNTSWWFEPCPKNLIHWKDIIPTSEWKNQSNKWNHRPEYTALKKKNVRHTSSLPAPALCSSAPYTALVHQPQIEDQKPKWTPTPARLCQSQRDHVGWVIPSLFDAMNSCFTKKHPARPRWWSQLHEAPTLPTAKPGHLRLPVTHSFGLLSRLPC